MNAKSLRVGFCLFVSVALAQMAFARHDAARTGRTAATIHINGAGSTTINDLLPTWVDEYHRSHTGVRVSYQAIGSNGGIRQLTAGESSFAATDVPLSDAELTGVNGRILAFPVALNAIVPIYNLPMNPVLRFSGSTLAGIFLGKITKWDDPAIASDNPAVDLPRMEIKVAHSFPGGTVDTQIMADYLSKVSLTFKATLASSSSANWPAANAMAGFRGAEGMHQFIGETPGSIGYLPLALARFDLNHGDQGKFECGAVRNSAGEFVLASSESVTAASAADVPLIEKQAPNFRVSITNAPGKDSFPIASFIWLNLYENSAENKNSHAAADFLKWILTDGQRSASKLGYPPLPIKLVDLELYAGRSM